jgi:3-hydroxyacyl-CoA dehydrogenase
LSRAVMKSARGQHAPPAAMELLYQTAPLPFAQGVAAERALFLTLRGSVESQALRRLFLAEREAGRMPDSQTVQPRQLKHLGVVGAGLMGCGIALAALPAGYAVTMLESDAESVARGIQRLGDLMTGAIKAGKLSALRCEDIEKAVSFHVDVEALAACDLVIEAVFEDMAAKKDVLQRIASVVAADCLIATNTSYLDVDALAAAIPNPGRMLGLHFFSPAHIMRLLEVVQAAQTTPEALMSGIQFARRLGKIPVIAGVGAGFIGNRIFRAYRAVAEAMVEDGATPAQVDAAMVDFGFPMGPFAVWDMAGLEISHANRQAKPVMRPDGRRLDLLERLVEAGRLGRKNGLGWYAYMTGEKHGAPDPAVEAIIAVARAEKGIDPTSFTQEAIASQLLAAMFDEGQAILREGIARAASDIDLVMVHGYGFPAHKGGPMFWAQQLSFGAPVGQ